MAVLTVAGCTGRDAGPSSSSAANTTAASTTAASTTAASATTSGATAASSPAGVSLAPGDRAACGVLYGHLQQVSAVIGASSELVTNSENPQQLAEHIGVEQAQLGQAAALMAQGPVPAPLAGSVTRLVAALRAFSDDFGKAKAPAARGDFAAAVTAMSDKAVVQQIIDASTAIEKACG